MRLIVSFSPDNGQFFVRVATNHDLPTAALRERLKTLFEEAGNEGVATFRQEVEGKRKLIASLRSPYFESELDEFILKVSNARLNLLENR